MTGPFIADACALIVFLADASLSTEATLAIQSPAFISPVTVWEMTRKASIGKLPIRWGDSSLATFLANEGFRLLPLTWQDAERANALPPLHKDPMDRMLIAQALREKATIITSDRLFEGYGVTTLW